MKAGGLESPACTQNYLVLIVNGDNNCHYIIWQVKSAFWSPRLWRSAISI